MESRLFPLIFEVTGEFVEVVNFSKIDNE